MNQNNAIATTDADAAIMERVLIAGDLKNLSPNDRVAYYAAVCRSVGLNPMTKPFDYITLNGKLTLYALKGATDQLRELRGISIVDLNEHNTGEIYIVWATARDATGRVDKDMGAASIKGLQGDALVNAMLKAITKAKRRVTLSLAGLGWLDETEVASIASAEPAPEFMRELDDPPIRSIVDVLTDELDAPAVDEFTLIERTEILQALREVDDRRDLKGIRDRMTAAGLWNDPQTSDAFQNAYDRLTGAQTATAGAQQPSLVN